MLTRAMAANRHLPLDLSRTNQESPFLISFAVGLWSVALGTRSLSQDLSSEEDLLEHLVWDKHILSYFLRQIA